jgi:hypothetical protein
MELVDLALDVVNETESQDVKTQDELFTEYKILIKKSLMKC